MNLTAATLPYGSGRASHRQPHHHPHHPSSPRPASPRPSPAFECQEWGTIQVGDNRLIIGLIKRVHVRDELFDLGRYES